MNKNSWLQKTFPMFIVLGLIVFSFTGHSAEVTVIPLLDTPDNQVYYDKLLSSLKNADHSISVMMATADYYPEYPEGLQDGLYDALVNAKNRGVEVRIVLDKSDWSEEVTRTNQETAMYLRNRGLRVKLDDPEITTHAKTVIVDEEVVFLGSSNWNFPTYTETYQTNLKLVSPEVGRFYESIFNAVWQGKIPGRVKFPEFTGGQSVVPLVSAGKHRGYYEAARALIRGAEESINLVLFKITRYPDYGNSKSNLLTKELVEARNRGVEVRIVLDVNTWLEEINQSNRETTLWLLGRGIRKVKFDSPQVTTHSKALIVDGESVVVGSSNWSYYSLAKNVEVDVVINSAPRVANAFEVYFEEIWEKAEIPSRDELSGIS